MDFCTICGQQHDMTGCPHFTKPLRGWECPKCHAVMGPFQPSCIHCIPVVVTLSGKAPA